MMRRRSGDMTTSRRRLRRGRSGGPAWRDLLDESLAGVSSRPARLMLTTLGTVLGIAALVATMGIGQTASGQIGERFDAVSATRVVVEPGESSAAGGEAALVELPWDAPERVERLAGVVDAGTFSRVDAQGQLVRGSPVGDTGGASEQAISLAAASPGLFAAVLGELSTGRYFDAGHDARADPVAVLGRYAAERLGINRVDSQPSVFVGEQAYTVIGILDDVASRTELLDAVIIPVGTARGAYGLASPDALEIRTEIGATQLVGEQAPVAVDPNQPELLSVDVPPRPGQLRDAVSGDVNVLFLALGGVALLVGGLGIANVTLLSVLERVSEIGLRRAVGATRSQVAGQFLVESVIIGLLGGLIGAAVGVLMTVGVSAARGWTPVMDVQVAAGAPLLGALVGLMAGTYPAWRASAIEPITALRSGGG